MEKVALSALMTAILNGEIEPQLIRVEGREESCPICGTSAWYGPRAFPGQPISYVLCKWCGFRNTIPPDPVGGTLAVPVYHRCPGDRLLLTWHQFEGEGYAEKQWGCDCGATVRIMDSLRPFPRVSRDPTLVELPGS